jgi:hypothetical protein
MEHILYSSIDLVIRNTGVSLPEAYAAIVPIMEYYLKAILWQIRKLSSTILI